MRSQLMMTAMMLLPLIADAGEAALVHRYSFNDGTARDSVGTAHGTLINNTGKAKYVNGCLVLGNDGSQKSGDSPLKGDYVDLPNGIISALGDDATFEFWVTWSGPTASYLQQFMSFGTGGSGEGVTVPVSTIVAATAAYVQLCPMWSGTSGGPRVEFCYGPTSRALWHFEVDRPMPIGSQIHVALVFDSSRKYVVLYINGSWETAFASGWPFSLRNFQDNNNWLGMSEYSASPMFVGSYNEVRIYNHVMGQAEALDHYRAGPDDPSLTVSGPTYSGGRGTADDPYQIATPQDLIDLGLTPADYYSHKHFILTKDIDLAGHIFSMAVIAPYYDANSPQFGGRFDGNGHVVRNLVIDGGSNLMLGLFGEVGPSAEIEDLGVEGASIIASDEDSAWVGCLAGWNWGTVSNCHSSGTVKGGQCVGGLVGFNRGDLTNCFSIAMVTAGSSTRDDAGGLVGTNWTGTVSSCYSAGAIVGKGSCVGGLIGDNWAAVMNCYSLSSVASASEKVGGLVGWNLTGGTVKNCYSSGQVTSSSAGVGGLVGSNSGSVSNSFWDTQTSGRTQSAGGTGVVTASMKDPNTYLQAGWDFAGETVNGPNDVWCMPRLRGYPILEWTTVYPGKGTQGSPFSISTVDQFVTMSHHPEHWDKSFVLAADVNMAGEPFLDALIAPSPALASGGTPVSFTGRFNGDGHTISNLTITAPAQDTIGLFGSTGLGAVITKLALDNCKITGGQYVGGLVGRNKGQIQVCSTNGQVGGSISVGGLVGFNEAGSIADCYARTGVKATTQRAGGLVGWNQGTIQHAYSAGAVIGPSYAGGLVGGSLGGSATNSFWDTQTSTQTQSAGGTGKMTAQMQQSDTFVKAGWDFVDESANGTADLWTIAPGDYPVFAWQMVVPPIPPVVAWWKLDETSGTVAKDSAGSNDGAIFGATWVAGKIGGALQFNGMSSYVSCGNADALAPEKMTLSVWISFPAASSKEYVVGKALGLSAVKDYSLACTAEGRLEFYFSDSSGKSVTASTSSAVPSDTWVHVAAVRDGSKALIYVNGVLAGSQGYTFTATNKKHPLTLGALNPSVPMAFFKGKIDDVRLYDVPLSASQVMSLYQQAAGQ